MKKNTLYIHTDGGSRGNPGPAACGFVAVYNGDTIAERSKFLNIATNNIAEYSAVILALEWLLKYKNVSKFDDVMFVLDSELVVRQLHGIYKVKNKELIMLNMEIKKYLAKITKNISFKNVPREENKIADELVNEELDCHV